MEDAMLLKELDTRFQNSHNEVINSVRKDLDVLRGTTSKDLESVRAEVGGVRKDLESVRAEVGGVRKDLDGLRSEVSGVRKDIDTLRETTSKEFTLLRESIGIQISSLIKVVDMKPDLQMVAKLAWIIVGSVVAGATLALAAARVFLVP